jgi:predicted dehydrogenase
MSPLRAGILGVGGIAHKHAQAIQQLHDQVELVACCGRDENKTRALAEQYTAGRALIFTNHNEMFERASLDIVIICLPPFAHTDEVERAAEHNINLLIEKPIALDSETAWNMVSVSERSGIKTQVGFMYRFGDAVEQFKTQLDAGELGPIGLMSARYFANSLHASWWRERAKSGGQVVEQAIHLFDLLRYFGGNVARVYSRQANLFHRDVPNYDIEDVSATILEFANGALGIVYATNAAVPNQWTKEWSIVTQNLLAEFSDWNHATFTPTHIANALPQTVASERNVFVAQLQDLLNAIQTDGATSTPLREGARSLDLVLAAVRSSESGEPILKARYTSD